MDTTGLLKRALSILVYGTISTIIGFLLAILIHQYVTMRTYDIMAVIGLFIVCIGALSSISGNPSGVNLSSTGQMNSQYVSQLNLEVTKMERESTNYFENTAHHAKFHFIRSSIHVILCGVFVIVGSVVLSYLM